MRFSEMCYRLGSGKKKSEFVRIQNPAHESIKRYEENVLIKKVPVPISEQLVRKVIKKRTAQKLNEASFSTAWTAGLKLNILNTPLVLMSWLVRVGLLLS